MKRTIAFDLDDVICTRNSNEGKVEKYYTCSPVKSMVEVVNNCYNDGNIVIIYTARGMTGFNGNVSKIYSNLYDLTLKQLNDWGVKYHQLVMGKLHYDLLIDDKAINSLGIDENDIENFFKEQR